MSAGDVNKAILVGRVAHVDDNSTFELPRHVHPSNINGFAAERWRADGCPTPAPFAGDEGAAQ